MKKVSLFFFLLLTTLCGCQEPSITRQEPTTATNQVWANATPTTLGGIITKGPALPSPAIIEKTYVPTNEFYADTRCRAWRITWPTYPAGTSPNLIPTMFSIAAGTPYSFNFLNNTAAANTYKTDFNLYYNNRLASVYDMSSELSHVVGNSSHVEDTRFIKQEITAAGLEIWVKEWPSRFQTYWKYNEASSVTEIESYQKDDVYLFKLAKQNRYGGIRIVSMSPRIIEVYLAEPNK